ncbi:hypothetical protein WA158_003303 [Blastocystis sp. Blastoise]
MDNQPNFDMKNTEFDEIEQPTTTIENPPEEPMKSVQQLPLQFETVHIDLPHVNVPIDDVCDKAMKEEKNRAFMISMEHECIGLINDTNSYAKESGSYDSFKRLLLHRIASRFNMSHNTINTDHVFIEKTDNMCIPVPYITEICDKYRSLDPYVMIPKKILSRPVLKQDINMNTMNGINDINTINNNNNNMNMNTNNNINSPVNNNASNYGNNFNNNNMNNNMNSNNMNNNMNNNDNRQQQQSNRMYQDRVTQYLNHKNKIVHSSLSNMNNASNSIPPSLTIPGSPSNLNANTIPSSPEASIATQPPAGYYIYQPYPGYSIVPSYISPSTTPVFVASPTLQPTQHLFPYPTNAMPTGSPIYLSTTPTNNSRPSTPLILTSNMQLQQPKLQVPNGNGPIYISTSRPSTPLNIYIPQPSTSPLPIYTQTNTQ